MTKEIVEAEEIGVIFYEDGSMSTYRGAMNTHDAVAKIKQSFIMPANTPLYHLSDYWGYQKVQDSWKEIKDE